MGGKKKEECKTNELQVFSNDQFGEIRTVEIGGEPWFVGKDIASNLGYKDTVNALKSHVDSEDKAGWQITTQFGNKETTIINESGLYSLVLSSKLPTAKAFKRWVTSEVIPSIRKHGAYMTPDTLDRMIGDPEFGIRLLTELKREREKRIALEATVEMQKQAIADFQPVKQYVDTILASKGAIAITQIAADYGLSAVKLNKILHAEGIQRKVNKQWVLYERHMGKGYTQSQTFPIVHHDGTPGTVIQTYWTQKGRLMIHELLKKRGIVPEMDK